MKPNESRGYCMTAYWDHDVYLEPCTGNNYQRWTEAYDNNMGGWRLINKATGEFLDSNGTDVYSHQGSDWNYYQLWH
ncbi:hypothetical protein ABZX98_16895 [Streptomyces sp. NPDC002992]|uniref:hypothetical protein n=1 Tax=Streptomyces sp. NPDC002992 TaxID=3154273 RepID=UPI00339FA63B